LIGVCNIHWDFPLLGFERSLELAILIICMCMYIYIYIYIYTLCIACLDPLYIPMQVYPYVSLVDVDPCILYIYIYIHIYIYIPN